VLYRAFNGALVKSGRYRSKGLRLLFSPRMGGGAEMKQETIEKWRTDNKKGLAEIRKRISGAMRNPTSIEINPDTYLFGGTHGIGFKISNDKFQISGEVRIRE
jgi:hypothetical protein